MVTVLAGAAEGPRFKSWLGHLSVVWMAPWKNRISSTTMKLRKSLVNSVNIPNECLRILINCSQLSKTYYNALFSSSPEIIMHAAYIGGHFRRTKITREASDAADISQNISSCLVLPPEIVMHDAFNVILWTSADMCVVVHDNLGWKNRTTRYKCNFFLLHHWLHEWFSSSENVHRYMQRAWRSRVEELNNTL